jgi:uncharacterized protein YcbK (DUF882 family)
MRALALVAFLATPVFADEPEPEPSKKDRERAGKATNTKKLPVPGKKPAKLVNLVNTWTDEWLAVEVGGTAPARTVDRFLRDHFTNQPNPMEPKLLGILMSAAASFQADQVMVVSAFRHPKYNLILRKKGHQVARDSQHTHGNAVDFHIPRVSVGQLHAWAKAQGIGGVGLYVDSGFIHMDTGKIRFWSGE